MDFVGLFCTVKNRCCFVSWQLIKLVKWRHTQMLSSNSRMIDSPWSLISKHVCCFYALLWSIQIVQFQKQSRKKVFLQSSDSGFQASYQITIQYRIKAPICIAWFVLLAFMDIVGAQQCSRKRVRNVYVLRIYHRLKQQFGLWFVVINRNIKSNYTLLCVYALVFCVLIFEHVARPWSIPLSSWSDQSFKRQTL